MWRHFSNQFEKLRERWSTFKTFWLLESVRSHAESSLFSSATAIECSKFDLIPNEASLLDFFFLVDPYCGHSRPWVFTGRVCEKTHHLSGSERLSIIRHLSAGLGRSNTMATAGETRPHFLPKRVRVGPQPVMSREQRRPRITRRLRERGERRLSPRYA